MTFHKVFDAVSTLKMAKFYTTQPSSDWKKHLPLLSAGKYSKTNQICTPAPSPSQDSNGIISFNNNNSQLVLVSC